MKPQHARFDPAQRRTGIRRTVLALLGFVLVILALFFAQVAAK